MKILNELKIPATFIGLIIISWLIVYLFENVSPNQVVIMCPYIGIGLMIISGIVIFSSIGGLAYKAIKIRDNIFKRIKILFLKSFQENKISISKFIILLITEDV